VVCSRPNFLSFSLRLVGAREPLFSFLFHSASPSASRLQSVQHSVMSWSSLIVFSSSSRSCRILIASSARPRRVLVAFSSRPRRVLVASSSRPRRVLVVPGCLLSSVSECITLCNILTRVSTLLLFTILFQRSSLPCYFVAQLTLRQECHRTTSGPVASGHDLSHKLKLRKLLSNLRKLVVRMPSAKRTISSTR
jgi:hypothetical protein